MLRTDKENNDSLAFYPFSFLIPLWVCLRFRGTKLKSLVWIFLSIIHLPLFSFCMTAFMFFHPPLLVMSCKFEAIRGGAGDVWLCTLNLWAENNSWAFLYWTAHWRITRLPLKSLCSRSFPECSWWRASGSVVLKAGVEPSLSARACVYRRKLLRPLLDLLLLFLKEMVEGASDGASWSLLHVQDVSSTLWIKVRRQGQLEKP